MISALGTAIEYAFIFIFVAIPFVAFKLRQQAKLAERQKRSRQDEEHNTGSEANASETPLAEAEADAAKKGWWIEHPSARTIVNCASTLLIAPIGVATLRICKRANTVWHPVERVDDVSYRQAFAAMVVGALCCGLIQAMWRKLRLFVGGKRNADSSSTPGFVDLSTGHSEKEDLGDKA